LLRHDPLRAGVREEAAFYTLGRDEGNAFRPGSRPRSTSSEPSALPLARRKSVVAAHTSASFGPSRVWNASGKGTAVARPSDIKSWRSGAGLEQREQDVGFDLRAFLA